MTTEYIFDVKLWATIRVQAGSEAEARKMLSDALDCADANFGAWPNGDPILAEASMEGEADLAEDIMDDRRIDLDGCEPVDLNGTNPDRPTITLMSHSDGHTMIHTQGDEAKDWAFAVTGAMADPILDDGGVDIAIATGRMKGWRIIDARIEA